jgi:ABC-type proline/glycine betaine transport system ATPase subunit
LTTQYLEEADQLADRIAVIDHGRLVSEGTAPQLKDRVGGAVVQLRVPDADRARTLAALRDDDGEDPAVDEHDGRVTLAAPDGARTLTVALRRLEAAGITPQDAALRKQTLDEAFLALTGHHATAANGNGRAQPVEASRGAPSPPPSVLSGSAAPSATSPSSPAATCSAACGCPTCW